jgi:hypothetical protein
MKRQREKNVDVGAEEPRDGELEHEIDAETEDGEDDELERHAAKKLEHERALKNRRNKKYKGKKAREREQAKAAAKASGTGDPEVDEAIGQDPELAKVYQQFAGKIGTAEDLAGVYAMLFAPIGFWVDESFELHDPATGKPTAEALQLARGTWPLCKKYAGSWLSWVRAHSAEVLAISTVVFFASRKMPALFKVINDPSQLRINRLRAAAAHSAASASSPPAREPKETAAASQVVSIDSQQEAA